MRRSYDQRHGYTMEWQNPSSAWVRKHLNSNGSRPEQVSPTDVMMQSPSPIHAWDMGCRECSPSGMPGPADALHSFFPPPSPISPPPVTPATNQRWSHDGRRTIKTSRSFIRKSVDTHEDSSRNSNFKRRRSNEYSWTGFANGVRSTWGTLSKRSSGSRHISESFVDARLSPPPSPSQPRSTSSRSASRAQMTRESNEMGRGVGLGIDTILEDEDRASLYESQENTWAQMDGTTEAVPVRRSTTRLLPQFVEAPASEQWVQSPLQSPSVVAMGHTSSDPVLTTRSIGLMTPPLSQRPSVASFRRSRANTVINSNDIPPLHIEEEAGDQWTELLGHANFTINPAPYVPETADGNACRQLMADWKEARSEYLRHRAGTERHFGASSRIYHWTEAKWGAIDARWRECSELAFRRALEHGEAATTVAGLGLERPGPLPKTTVIDDPRIVQSAEIVGPMEVAAPVAQHAVVGAQPAPPSKKEQLLKLLIPKTRRARSDSSNRPL